MNQFRKQPYPQIRVVLASGTAYARRHYGGFAIAIRPLNRNIKLRSSAIRSSISQPRATLKLSRERSSSTFLVTTCVYSSAVTLHFENFSALQSKDSSLLPSMDKMPKSNFMFARYKAISLSTSSAPYNPLLSMVSLPSIIGWLTSSEST
jgi:hypothetical protein